MRLLYCFTEFLDEKGAPRPFRGLDKIELNLSTKHRFSFDSATNTLRCAPRTAPLPDGFWVNEAAEAATRQASNLYNVNIIAGQNGSGKSTMIYYIIELLGAIYSMFTNNAPKYTHHDPSTHRNILLFEDDQQPGNDPEGKKWFLMNYIPETVNIPTTIHLYGFSDGTPETYCFSFQRWLSPDTLNRMNKDGEAERAMKGISCLIKKTKIIYMTNTLTRRNQALYQKYNLDTNERRYNFLYDCAIGTMIGSNAEQFFNDEVYRQVKYVFEKKQYSMRVMLDAALTEAMNVAAKNSISKLNTPLMIMPKTLTLWPRIEKYVELFSDVDDKLSELYTILSIPIAVMTSASILPRLLGVLCVAAHMDNISMSINRRPDDVLKGYIKTMGHYQGSSFFEKMKYLVDDYTSYCKSEFRDKEYGFEFFDNLVKWCQNYLDFLSDAQDTLFSHFYTTANGRGFVLPIDIAESEELFPVMFEFIQKYRYTCQPNYTIDFDWGLSSGEENMLRLFSNLYHIFDCDDSDGRNGDYTIYNNYGNEPCDTVLLFMDEADLTLHPEWQRTLLYILTAYLPNIYPQPNIRDIQLILSTHSPLLLGDIPSENVTYLKDGSMVNGGDNQAEDVPSGTFGQNIHTILKESFFLGNGTVGEFAAKKINATARRLKQLAEGQACQPGELDKLRQMVALVAPGILRARLDQLLQEAELRAGSEEDRINQLFEQFRKLSPDAQERFKKMEGSNTHD